MAKMRIRQKLAIASWDAPMEGNIYGKIAVDATNALAYLEHVRAESGAKVTLTTLVGRAAAEVLKRAPGLNGRIRFGQYIQSETVDVAFLVNLEGGNDLAKAKVCNADTKSLVEIARELQSAADKLRKGEDAAFNKSRGPLAMLPMWIVKPLVHFTGFLTGVLGIDVAALGLEAYPFGTCIITSVGMFGIDEAYAPPTPWAHVPVYLLVGAVRDTPVVVDGAIVIRPMLTISATIDHRFIDGAQLGVLSGVLRDALQNPWKLDGLQGPPSR